MSITPSTKQTIGIEKAKIQYIAGKRNITYNQVLTLIRNILHETLDLTIKDLEGWIKKKVPKRTGQLRDNLIKNLHSSRVVQGIARLIMGTNIDYAEDVNQYTTQQVRHKGEVGYAYYYGHYGKIMLYDPEAIGHFWDFMRVYARTRILYNLAKVKKKYLAHGTVLKSKDLAEVKKR